MNNELLRKLADEQVNLFMRAAKVQLKPDSRWILADILVRFGHKLLSKEVSRSTELHDSTGELIIEGDWIQVDIGGKLWNGIVGEFNGVWYVVFEHGQASRLDEIHRSCVVLARP